MMPTAWADGTPGWWTTDTESDIRISPNVDLDNWCRDDSPPLIAHQDTGLFCTRTGGHTGRHAAYGLHAVLAVWP